MFSRRSFLTSAGMLALVQLSGCSEAQAALKVLLLEGSIPPQLLAAFRKQAIRKKLIVKPKSQLQDLWGLLQNWHSQNQNSASKQLSSSDIADLVTIGDYWLAEAIQNGLIQPLSVDRLEQWQKLPPRFVELMQRNSQGRLDPNGAVWGAPYRWGSTLMVYRRDQFKKLGWTPSDWSDLWREELKDRISLPDQPREVIGLTLKKLGYSYNTENLNEVPNLKSELLALQQQVKFYSSDNYLQPLILEDTWLAVGWSTDTSPIQKRYSTIKTALPRSGTSLWADVWVNPQPAATSDDLLHQWIDFCWLPRSASQISLFTAGASPMILSLPNQLPPGLQNNQIIQGEKQVFEESEFLLPLSPQAQQQYQKLWQEVRTSVNDQ